MEFTYFGMLRSPVSWAKIGRELVYAFLRSGDTVHSYERRGFSYNKDFKLPPEIEKTITAEFQSDKTLAFEYPGNYRYITTRQKYGMLVYETTAAPKEWAQKANESLDLLFLPNEFNRKIFIAAGVKPEIIRVVPHGINEEVFKTRSAELGTRSEGQGRTRNNQLQTSNIKLQTVLPPHNTTFSIMEQGLALHRLRPFCRFSFTKTSKKPNNKAVNHSKPV
jgi:hypothetical protein